MLQFTSDLGQNVLLGSTGYLEEANYDMYRSHADCRQLRIEQETENKYFSNFMNFANHPMERLWPRCTKIRSPSCCLHSFSNDIQLSAWN